MFQFIKKFKMFFICGAIELVLLLGCFGYGYHVGRTKSNSNRTESGGLQGTSFADNAEDKSNNAINSLGTAMELNNRAIESNEVLLNAIQKQRVYLNEVVRAVNTNKELSETLNGNLSELSDATDYAFELAIGKAELYEQLIGELQPIVEHYEQDNTIKQ